MECLSVELCSVSTCVVGFVGLVIAVYKYMTWTHDTFRKMGIPGPAPGILGNMSDFAKDGLTKTDVRYVREYGRVVGLFHARCPVMLVSDPEMVREICVKQFPNFNKRVDPGPVDKSFRGAITVAEDDHWKCIRSVLSPIFSSSKIKQMVSGIEKCTAQLTRNLRQLSEGGKGVEMKRFLPENKGQLHNYYYAPFGVGPKSCIGMRLATLNFKMTVVSILQHFRLETTPNTEVPPELEKGVFVKPKNGMFLQLVQRGR